MDSAFPFLIFLIVLALIAVFAYFSYLQTKARREALGRLAADLGWRFDGFYYTPDDEYTNFEIFRRGHSPHAGNTLVGQMEIHGHPCPARMGDYRYKVTSSNGKTTTTHTYEFSYLMVHLPYASLPDLLIRHEGIFDRLKSAFGFPDINFESAEFSKRFYVKCPDKRFAYDVITPAMIEYLLAGDAMAVGIENCHCCLSDGSSTWMPAEFQQKLQWLRGFFDIWPEHVTSALACN